MQKINKEDPNDKIDFLLSAGSDICEGIRDLVYCIKEIRDDVNDIKKERNEHNS